MVVVLELVVLELVVVVVGQGISAVVTVVHQPFPQCTVVCGPQEEVVDDFVVVNEFEVVNELEVVITVGVVLVALVVF